MAFDFIANEGKARKIMQDYLGRMKDYKGKPIYVTGNFEVRNEIHLASPVERYDLALGFVNEFFRIYDVGMAFQRQGKEVRVAMSS